MNFEMCVRLVNVERESNNNSLNSFETRSRLLPKHEAGPLAGALGLPPLQVLLKLLHEPRSTSVKVTDLPPALGKPSTKSVMKMMVR